MFAERPQALAGDSRASDVGSAGTDAGPAGTGSFGARYSGSTPDSRSSRGARKKRGVFHRGGIALPAAVLALLLVAVVWGAAKVMNHQGEGASSLFDAIDGLGSSGSVALLEQERTTLIEMTAANKTLSVAAKPAMADPEQILEAQDSNTASSRETTGGVGVTTTAPPSNPTAAQATAQSLLGSEGFSSAQWPCLYDLWEQESSWNVYADNAASGAYGIPQSLPGDKMATFGSDWQTNPTTQIKWGLSYIKSVYGTPCGAWANEKAYGYY